MPIVIKNSDGFLLKYLYKDKCVWNHENSRAFRYYPFAKQDTVDKTLKKLAEWGHIGCTSEFVTEEELENFNVVEKRKEKKESKETEIYQNLIDAVDPDEKVEYLKQCIICSRGCKMRTSVTIYGRCPQLDVMYAN